MLYSAGCSIEGDNDCTWTLESLVGNEESEYGCAISSDLTGKAVLIPYETTIGNCSVYEKVCYKHNSQYRVQIDNNYYRK